MDIVCDYFAAFSSLDSLQNIVDDVIFQQNNKSLILGGGSNILFTKNVEGIVLKNELKGIEKIEMSKRSKIGFGKVGERK